MEDCRLRVVCVVMTAVCFNSSLAKLAFFVVVWTDLSLFVSDVSLFVFTSAGCDSVVNRCDWMQFVSYLCSMFITSQGGVGCGWGRWGVHNVLYTLRADAGGASSCLIQRPVGLLRCAGPGDGGGGRGYKL